VDRVQGGTRGSPGAINARLAQACLAFYHWASRSGGQPRCGAHARPSMAAARGDAAQAPRV